jgi:UDP:flavonoid glycosyltransferase YjiC (YdhE family)
MATDSEIAFQPPDFGDHVENTGFLFVEDEEAALPVELTRFVDDGGAPAYIGFGSTPIDDVSATEKTIAAVAEQTGLRLVVSQGPSRLGEGRLSELCFTVGAVNHRTLFPRMAAIVHHGGAGTTAEAARSGRPQIIVPHSADQFYWGHRVAEVGIGPRPLPFKKMSAKALASRLRMAISSEEINENARRIGRGLAESDGAEVAVRRLEEICQIRVSGGSVSYPAFHDGRIMARSVVQLSGEV